MDHAQACCFTSRNTIIAVCSCDSVCEVGSLCIYLALSPQRQPKYTDTHTETKPTPTPTAKPLSFTLSKPQSKPNFVKNNEELHQKGLSSSDASKEAYSTRQRPPATWQSRRSADLVDCPALPDAMLPRSRINQKEPFIPRSH